ncbi:putative PAPA-1-like conserved region [Lyophyllum shimeji]|uniref:PAPA-1-like conserved region n=1 Tax=Lyophyllum shimeji TaxID=47721 RepID=A0A9P3PM55_LYOSH|nr:putative PAPA-1-like conserved region [Lyophyllum shimeji]
MAAPVIGSSYHGNDPEHTNATRVDSDVEMESEERGRPEEQDNEEKADEEASNIDMEAVGEGEGDEDEIESEDEEEEEAGEEDEEEQEDEIQSDADEQMSASVSTPTASSSRLKIRLKMPAQSSSRYDTPVVESEDSMSNDSHPVTTRPMTTRQAVLASVLDPTHVSLGGSRQKKAPLNETELALRREETARKRKNLSEKKLEDEKAETINRLLKKQSRPRNKRTTAQRDNMDDVAPPGSLAGTRSNSTSAYNPTTKKKGAKKAAAAEEQGEGEEEEAMDAAEESDEEELLEREVQIPTMYRWISSRRIPASEGEKPGEPQMRITFSVPVSALPLPPASVDVLPDAMQLDQKPRHAITRPTECAAPGCGKPFRYRLVKDWTRGACGITCLKLLEASL